MAAGQPGAWNRRNFWAPEVLAHEGRFYLFYTAMPDGTPGNTGNRVGLAVADRPEGPYTDRGVVVGHASLDGSPFRDADGPSPAEARATAREGGTLYLYYTAEFGTADGMTPGRIYVDQLVALSGDEDLLQGPAGRGDAETRRRGENKSDGLAAIPIMSGERVLGRPVELVAHHKWQEGPCVLFREGRYFLFYSTGNWGDASYAVRWAAGDSPLGPFAEDPQPLLVSTPAVIGPGHNNFFRTPDGADWIVYHGWAAEPGTGQPDRRYGRMPRIDRLHWRAGRPVVEGPTVMPQGLTGSAE